MRRIYFTKRERQILRCVLSKGLGTKELAFQLGTSRNTMNRHIKNIFDKTGHSTLLELMLFILNDADLLIQVMR